MRFCIICECEEKKVWYNLYTATNGYPQVVGPSNFSEKNNLDESAWTIVVLAVQFRRPYAQVGNPFSQFALLKSC